MCAGLSAGPLPEGGLPGQQPILALRLAFNLPSASYATMLVCSEPQGTVHVATVCALQDLMTAGGAGARADQRLNVHPSPQSHDSGSRCAACELTCARQQGSICAECRDHYPESHLWYRNFVARLNRGTHASGLTSLAERRELGGQLLRQH